MIDPAKYELTDDLSAHPAVRAWSRLRGHSVKPRSVEVLRRPLKGGKSCTFRICRNKRKGSSIVAKLCLKEIAQLEDVIYGVIMPELPLARLEYYGTIASEEPDMDWIFVQDAGQVLYSREDEAHRRLAAEWFATLHTAAVNLPVLQQLPDRGVAHFLDHLRSGRELLKASRPDPVLTGEQRSLLDHAVGHLDYFESMWPELESRCRNMPCTLVHGDFAGRNARVRGNGERRELAVFDWELGGRGAPAIDLATSRIYVSPRCLDVYHSQISRTWPGLTKEDTKEMVRVGRIFRVIASIDWIALTLSVQLSFQEPEWLIAPISTLECYVQRIDDVLREPARLDHRADRYDTSLEASLTCREFIPLP